MTFVIPSTHPSFFYNVVIEIRLPPHPSPLPPLPPSPGLRDPGLGECARPPRKPKQQSPCSCEQRHPQWPLTLSLGVRQRVNGVCVRHPQVAHHGVNHAIVGIGTGGAREPGEPRQGWQKLTADVAHTHHRALFFPQLTKPQRALLRFQSGPLVSVPFTALPVNRSSASIEWGP